jgi:predicted nucleic acid-binding protein
MTACSSEYSIRIKQATIGIKSKYGCKLADAFIAASAIEFDIPLVSADKGFSKIKELNFINILPTS